MKDITIKVSSIVKELKIWMFLVILAFLTNVYAITKFEGQWLELYSQLHIILILSVFYYVVVLLLRGILFGVRVLFNSTKEPVSNESQ